MKKPCIAILIFGESPTARNALTEEKYKNLGSAFKENGFDVHSVIYNDALADQLLTELIKMDATLVWVNPVEQGNNRNKLDVLLRKLSAGGCFVSAHPDVILQIGTKDVFNSPCHRCPSVPRECHEETIDWRKSCAMRERKLRSTAESLL